MRQGSIRRQSILGSGALYIGQGLGLVNKIILFPLVFAGEEVYWGMLVFFASLSSVLGGLSTLGFSRVIQHFVPKHPERATQIIQYGLLWSTLAGFLAFGALLLLGSRLQYFSSSPQLFDSLFGVLILLFVGQWFFELGSSIFAAYYKAHIGLFVNNVAIRFLQLILLIIGVLGVLSILEFIWLFAVIVVLNHVVLFILSLREIPTADFSDVAAPIKNGGWNYALFMTVLTLVSQFFLHLDGILVGHFLILSQLAYLDLAKNLSAVIEMPARAIGASSQAKLSRLLGVGDLKQVGAIYNKASFIQLFLGLIIYSLIATHLDLLIYWFPSVGYSVVKPLFLVLALGKFVDLATGLNWAIITNSEKYTANLWIGLLTLIGVVGIEWWLIPRFGLFGAAWGVVLAYFLNNAFRSCYVWFYFKQQPFAAFHIKLIPLFILAAISSIHLFSSVLLEIICKNVVFILIIIWYSKPGRTLPEFDDVLQVVRKKLSAKF